MMLPKLILKLTFLLILLWSSDLSASETYLKVKAERGDGVHVLLTRFKLDRHSCNYTEFYRLNNLEANSALILNRTYKLPVKVYTFNSKTIRSTIGITDYNTAKRIEIFNDKMSLTKLKEGDFRKDKVLWVPYGELACPGEAKEAIETIREYDILGKEQASVKLKSRKLEGAVYYIVAGHGGPDPGAMTKNGKHSLCEDEYAYDVSLRLTKYLLEHGALVYMIIRDENDGIRNEMYLQPDTDEVCWGNKPIPLKQIDRLQQRAEVVNKLYKENKAKGYTYQRLLVLHIDSRNLSQRIDLFFYHHPESDLGKQVCTTLHQTIKKKYKKYRKDGSYTGTVLSRDLYMVRETLPTSIFMELGNIRNKHDQKRFLLKENRDALAKWLLEGLILDF